MNDLKPDERIEDLQYGGLKIIQSASEYRFTTDAVLLANFVKGAKGAKWWWSLARAAESFRC